MDQDVNRPTTAIRILYSIFINHLILKVRVALLGSWQRFAASRSIT